MESSHGVVEELEKEDFRWVDSERLPYFRGSGI